MQKSPSSLRTVHAFLKSTLAFLALASAPLSADTTAKTDLASITVTPVARTAGAPADWRTIYDYEGGNPAAGVRLTATAPWIEPTCRIGPDGVTWAFPNLPNQTGSAQDLNIGFSYERPLADYPTRVTIHYTSHFDQFVTKPWCWWMAFLLTSGSANYDAYMAQLRGLNGDDPAAKANYPIHATGPNTVVMNFDGKGKLDLTINDKPCPDFLTDNFRKPTKNVGAMLINGFAIRNHYLQQPSAQGDWFTVNSFKIEQQRPDPAVSSVAAIDLDVPGNDPVTTTIEVSDAKNDSRGYVLRDVPVYPGHYRLYWDGINQKQGMAHNTTWISAGNYSFHLTTSHAQSHYAGQPNNSTGKYNYDSWGLVDCTSLCMTPPGTTVVPDWDNAVDDKRGLQGDDSVQLTSMGYDAKYGQWLTADGYYISGKTGSGEMQCGRGTTVTPPDPKTPKDPTKQFFFCSKAIGNGDSVVSSTIPAMFHNAVSKTLTSPDWNRGPAGWQSYKVRFGDFSPTLWGPQHHLLFPTSMGGPVTHADWIYRNIRVYEEGQPDPGPITFDRSKFRARPVPWANTKPVLTFASLRLEDNGRSIHIRNAVPADYPFAYNVTAHTIIAFDVNVIDASGSNWGNGIGLSPSDVMVDGEMGRCINFMGQIFDSPSQFGLADAARGAYTYPQYEPNCLYTDHVPLSPRDSPGGIETNIMWRPGFYGVKVSEDGHFLFACNNADNRIEVRDISIDGHAIAKIPFDHPMYLTWAADGALGAPKGTRYIFVDSPTRGIMRIPWHTADNTFGPPTRLTPASEFAYPRGLVYSAADNRLFVCDGYNLKRTRIADQIVVIDPQTGSVVSRFGKKGGVDPKVGGTIDDQTFTCPLTIDADSKGALWVNDFYTAEVRKYDFDPASNGFKVERRVNGPNTTNIAHFYWMPGDPPTRTWTVGQGFIRTDSDLGSDGLFTNQRNTSTTPLIDPGDQLRPFAHTYQINGHVYYVTYTQIAEQVGDGFKVVAQFGGNAGDVARNNGLLAAPGQPPTELDKAIAASGDKNWAQRNWAWSDLDGDGKMSYSAKNPEFQIGFNSTVHFNDYIPASGCLRPSDGAYVHTADGGLAVFTPTIVNGRLFYTLKNTRIVPIDCIASDVIVQDGRYIALACSTQRHDIGDEVVSYINCYDVAGKKLWTRDHNDYTLVCLQPLGNGQFTVMDRGGWTTEGPIMIRNDDGDLITEAFCLRPGDCWSNGVLRVDDDTAYIGLVQAYKVTGLSTAQSGVATAPLPAAGL